MFKIGMKNQAMKKDEGSRRSSRFKRGYPFRWEWLILVIVILLVVVIRIRLLDVPLERDEGEYAYAGQLILQGIPPFQEVRMPGVYVAYALIMGVFGETHTGIHLGLLLVNMGTVILLVFLGRRLCDLMTGVVAGASFAVLSLSQSVQGVFAQNEHFVMLFAVGGLLVLQSAVISAKLYRFLLSGLLFGFTFLMKQHGAAFVLFAALYIALISLKDRPVDWRQSLSKCGIFCVGAFIPFGVLCTIHILAGDFDNFWFWTFTYAREYVSSVPLTNGLGIFRARVASMAHSAVLMWVLGGIGLTALFWDRSIRPQIVFVSGFFLFSFLSICPGFYFRPHYFVFLLPSISLLIGLGVSSMKRVLAGVLPPMIGVGIPILLLAAAVFYSIYKERIFFFDLSPVMASRAIYGTNPFPESLKIGDYIRKHSVEDDRIAVIGSEPQIYFYSRRRAATNQVNMYELMESHQYALEMQRKMIKEIEAVQPKFIVFVSVYTSWLKKRESQALIFSWFQQYQKKYYKRIGIVDIVSPRFSVYRWGDDSVGYTPRSKAWIAILEREK